jgi:acyl carrier protein
MSPDTAPVPQDAAALMRELAAVIVEALNLEISPGAMDADAPLYGEGLGLDSIDILEIALVVSKHYGVQLKAESADNKQVFSSLRALAGYIAAHRTR